MERRSQRLRRTPASRIPESSRFRDSGGRESTSRALRSLIVLLASAAGSPLLAGDAKSGPDQDYFRETVEPILVERCYDCHSHDAGEASGGLMLDSKAGWEAGGDSGPAIVPGKPDESRLVRAVQYKDPLVEMPPDGKLSAEEIAAITEWVRRGAADPRGEGKVFERSTIDLAAGREFWSYRPIADPPPPTVEEADWPANEIDRFVLASLEAKGIKPAADADPATLVRRLSFDLTGLPPTPEQIDAFVRDPSDAAYVRLVDELLSQRAFGERWGRHWLDIARFGESVTLRGLIFKEAWRYRDYVIDAFDDDLPFDRFIREQIAGDLLPADTPADRERQLVATTYLMLGNTNLEEQDKVQLRMDFVDEQLDAITKGFLAQTVTCARCHDHKFDPIPTRDYYALAGILRNVEALVESNVSGWIEVPLPAPPEVEQAVAEHAAQVAALEARIKEAQAKNPGGGPSRATGSLNIEDAPGVVVDDTAAQKVGFWQESTSTGVYVAAGYVHDQSADKGNKTITYQPALPADGEYEIWLSYSPGQSRADNVPVTVFGAGGEKTIAVDMRIPPPLGNRFVSLGRHRFEKEGQSFVLISNAGTRGHVTADAVAFIPVAELAAAEEAFPVIPDGALDLSTLQAQLKRLKAKAPDRPMAMSVREEKEIADIPVHIRGSVHNLGEVVPRGFLQVASYGPAPTIPDDQSGRLELATWLTQTDNPLTSRVFVNRAWHWLFGHGIVRTVDNFGTTGEEPSNPELLDFLATRFIEDDWSVKRLVRRIVLSRTYRLSATADPTAIAADPENQLFGRSGHRRLDAECLRDAMLSISGELTPTDGGRTFPDSLSADYGYSTAATTRSVYLPAFRNALPEIFAAFDFANPSFVTGRRNVSTVPQQALFMLNNPFAVERAEAAAARLLSETASHDERIIRAYRLTLGREPTNRERHSVSVFLGESDSPTEKDWSLVFQALFASPDFRYLK